VRFDQLLTLVGRLPYFDFSTLVQLSAERRATLRTQLHRWSRQAKIVPLRRSFYMLAPPHRRVEVEPAVLANQIYRPSYLSFHWALGHYGLIPERVALYTSATPRVPRRFENPFGRFRYIHLKKQAFFGYRRVKIGGQEVLVATPEKALLDLWHVEKGPWPEERMALMRFQNLELIDSVRLIDAARRFRSPRLVRAARAWKAFAKSEAEGTREL
jgi:predicted transcriptional regulator of viral defense system